MNNAYTALRKLIEIKQQTLAAYVSENVTIYPKNCKDDRINWLQTEINELTTILQLMNPVDSNDASITESELTANTQDVAQKCADICENSSILFDIAQYQFLTKKEISALTAVKLSEKIKTIFSLPTN